MTLDEFIAKAKAGEIKVMGGGVVDGKFTTTAVSLDPANLSEATAEAYSHGVFQSTVRWPDAREQVRIALGLTKQGDLFE